MCEAIQPVYRMQSARMEKKKKKIKPNPCPEDIAGNIKNPIVPQGQ